MKPERKRLSLQPFPVILSLALAGIMGLEGLAIWLTQLQIDRLQAEVAAQAEFLNQAQSIAPDAAGVREAAAAAEQELAALDKQLPESLGATEILLWLRTTIAGSGSTLVGYSLGPPRREGRLTAVPVQVKVRLRGANDVLALLARIQQAPFPVRAGIRTFDFGLRDDFSFTLTVYTRKGVTYP